MLHQFVSAQAGESRILVSLTREDSRRPGRREINFREIAEGMPNEIIVIVEHIFNNRLAKKFRLFERQRVEKFFPSVLGVSAPGVSQGETP